MRAGGEDAARKRKLGGRRNTQKKLLAFTVAVLIVFVAAPFRPKQSSRSLLEGRNNCDYDLINKEYLYSGLQELMRKPFFRYFKVKLWCDCPFWPEEGMCVLRDCSVCECPEDEFPSPFKLSADDPKCQEGRPHAAVDKTLDKLKFHGWTEEDNPWTHDNETDDEGMTYVNLLLNPERYTGYTGSSARRIWDAIYKMNCFKDSEMDTCRPNRILYTVISGLHSSISTHIAADYLLDASKNKWGPNLQLLRERVLDYPERVDTLGFTFLFVLQSCYKIAASLITVNYDTSNPAEDEETGSLMRDLLTNKQLKHACPVPFDETQLWQGMDRKNAELQTREHFRNISTLMDCVGCEKCRLWGKIQILGLGTAFRVLFCEDVSSLSLQRNEVIALINLLAKLSGSLKFISEGRTSRI